MFEVFFTTGRQGENVDFPTFFKYFFRWTLLEPLQTKLMPLKVFIKKSNVRVSHYLLFLFFERRIFGN